MDNEDFQTQAHLANSRTVVRAKYSAPELPKFAGNPNIETLPLINTREQALLGMQRMPQHNDEMRALPAHIRTHLVMDVIHFFRPLSVNLKLEGMVSRMIRDGYLHRNPLDPSHSRDLKTRLKYFKKFNTFGDQFAPSGSGCTICGMSGVGKTTGLMRILNLYPQLIIHTCYKRKRLTRAQIVWLLLECPKNGSTKGLCTKFFKTIDYVMGGTTNYAKDYGKDTRNTNELMESMANVAATHQLGMLVIDEIQYLNVAKSGGGDEMLNFFVNLVNIIGLPVVIVGTYDAIPLLSSTFRQARRGSGQGDLVWDRMPFDNEWHLYAGTLWEYQYTQKKCPLTESLSLALHDVSYGIVDLANRIYLAAQVRAIETGKEEITEGVLSSAYRDDFRLVSHIIETLKSGGPSLLNNVRDVCPPAILPIKDSDENPVAGIAREQGNEKVICVPDAEENKVGSVPPQNTMEEAAAVKGSKNTERDQLFLTNSLPDVPTGRRKRGSRKSKATKATEANIEEKDLRGIVARGRLLTPPVDAYHALLTAGHIKDSAEFLSEDC